MGKAFGEEAEQQAVTLLVWGVLIVLLIARAVLQFGHRCCHACALRHTGVQCVPFWFEQLAAICLQHADMVLPLPLLVDQVFILLV